MADDKPIIIIKKSGGHGGHHGGAWKVAYADFVTAMMAFFMVMWLVNSAEVATKQNIASYFRKPGLFQSGSGTPLLIGESGILQDGMMPAPQQKRKKITGFGDASLSKKSGTDELADQEARITLRGEKGKGFIKGDENTHGFNLKQSGTGGPQTGDGPDKLDKAAIESIAADIKKVIAASPELQELLGVVDVKVEADGLNIEIMDTAKSSMFDVGSARVRQEAKGAFTKLAQIINDLPNTIDIVGHTDGKAYPPRPGGYSNWELSADRANAARRLLELQGVKSERITSVAGRADRELKNKDNPLEAENRRITLKMRFNVEDTINLEQDPLALEKFKEYEDKYQEQQNQEPVHSFTSQEIIDGKPKDKVIRLPNSEPRRANPEFFERDRIFGDSPVLGPPDPFKNL